MIALADIAEVAVIPADGRCDTTHPYGDGWRIIRSAPPVTPGANPGDGWTLHTARLASPARPIPHAAE